MAKGSVRQSKAAPPTGKNAEAVPVAIAGRRETELLKMLEARRGALRQQIREKIRDVRTEGPGERDRPRSEETGDTEAGRDVDMTLIQMASDTLRKLDQAVLRLEQGTYGDCDECGEAIAEARLIALPFALRCRRCEEVRETGHPKRDVLRRVPWTLLSGLID